MYKLIAIDLDGTLLNSYGDVSDENKKAIENAKNRGIEVVLTSGRMSASVMSIAEEVGADNYMISGNGALIYDLKNIGLLIIIVYLWYLVLKENKLYKMKLRVYEMLKYL